MEGLVAPGQALGKLKHPAYQNPWRLLPVPGVPEQGPGGHQSGGGPPAHYIHSRPLRTRTRTGCPHTQQSTGAGIAASRVRDGGMAGCYTSFKSVDCLGTRGLRQRCHHRSSGVHVVGLFGDCGIVFCMEWTLVDNASMYVPWQSLSLNSHSVLTLSLSLNVMRHPFDDTHVSERA